MICSLPELTLMMVARMTKVTIITMSLDIFSAVIVCNSSLFVVLLCYKCGGVLLIYSYTICYHSLPS